MATEMKLTQLSTSEFKLDSAEDFCLNSNGNCMLLLGSSNDVNIFELLSGCDTMVLMPYSNKQIKVSQNKPISEIIKNIDLVQIYENANVQESQELALDLIYTADSATDALKARVLQAGVINYHNTKYICCILTTYGYCEVFKKAAITKDWEPLNTNLSYILKDEVFPIEGLPSKIKTLDDLKSFTNNFIITCFEMLVISHDLVIYLGTAAGYIVVVKYNETSFKFEKHCHFKTSLNRISYIVIYRNLMLLASDEGKVILTKIDFESNVLQELDYLWNKSDRIPCRKCIFTFSEDLRSYFLVFCKSAHVFCYRLDEEGVVLSTAILYVSGIKVTGIESITVNEFIITTITGAVKYIKICYPTEEELFIEEQVIDHDFDSANYQILGLTTSSSKILWSFLLYRNKDYIHQSKYSNTSAFLNVCKLSNQDNFLKLTNSNLRTMNMAQDLIISLNLDIFNHTEIGKYMEYLNLEKLDFPDEINNAFLQKLQKKLIITRKLATYQTIKYKKVKPQTKNDMCILEPVLQILHILGRLRYLNKFNSKKIEFSRFQELSIACMQQQFTHLIRGFSAINNNDAVSDNLHKVIDKFVNIFMDGFERCKFDTSNFAKHIEKCMICNQDITNFVKCEQEHEIRRCSISCTQLTFFKTIHCPHCYVLARNDDAGKLEELFAPDDVITCIYCRFLLKQDEF